MTEFETIILYSTCGYCTGHFVTAIVMYLLDRE